MKARQDPPSSLRHTTMDWPLQCIAAQTPRCLFFSEDSPLCPEYKISIDKQTLQAQLSMMMMITTPFSQIQCTGGNVILTCEEWQRKTLDSRTMKKDLLVKLTCFQHTASIISISFLIQPQTLFLWLFNSQIEVSSFSSMVEEGRQTLQKWGITLFTIITEAGCETLQ